MWREGETKRDRRRGFHVVWGYHLCASDTQGNMKTYALCRKFARSPGRRSETNAIFHHTMPGVMLLVVGALPVAV